MSLLKHSSKEKGDLTQGSISKVITSFTLPLLVGNILLQFYSITDAAIIGQFLGKEALAGVSASFFIYYLLISLMIGIGSGITVIISQYTGAKNRTKVQAAFTSFILFLPLAGLIISSLGIWFAEPLFKLIKTPEAVLEPATTYFKVYMIGAFIFLMFNSFLSILRGLGDSKAPMWFILISTILNIGFDLLFIITFKWGVAGAAWATLLAQTLTLILIILYVHHHQPYLSLKWKDLKFNPKIFFQGLKIGIPTSIQQSTMALGLTAMLSIVNGFGSDALTAFGAAGKIESLISQIILTLSSATATFCGQNIGAGKEDRLQKGIVFGRRINFVFSLIMFIAIIFFRDSMMRIFISDPLVINIGSSYLLIISFFMVFNGGMNLLNGVMRGGGDTLFAMLISLFSLWIIRIPLAEYISSKIGVDGIWWATGISFFLGYLATLLYFHTGRWKNKAVTRQSKRLTKK